MPSPISEQINKLFPSPFGEQIHKIVTSPFGEQINKIAPSLLANKLTMIHSPMGEQIVRLRVWVGGGVGGGGRRQDKCVRRDQGYPAATPFPIGDELTYGVMYDGLRARGRTHTLLHPAWRGQGRQVRARRFVRELQVDLEADLRQQAS